MKHIFIAVIVTSMPFVVAVAQSSGIDTLAREIAAKNPAVAAAEASYTAELESARAANVLAGPEVDFDYSFSPEGSSDNRWGVSVGQSFDWPGVYRARSKANGYRAEAFRHLYLSRLSDATFEAKQILIRLAAAEEVAALMRTAADNIDRMHDAVEYAYSRGEVTAIDLKKIHIERFSLHSRLARAEAELEGLKATVKALNGGVLPPTVPLPAGAELESLEDYRMSFETGNPVLAASRSMVQALDADVSVARRSALPSFKVSYVHEYEDRTHFNGFSIGIALPSWSTSRSRRAAEAAVHAESLGSADYTIKMNAELMTNYATAVSLSQRLNKARCAFEGDDYGDLLRTALEKGAITVLNYLTEYNSYLDAAAEYVALKAEMAQAIAFLNRYNP